MRRFLEPKTQKNVKKPCELTMEEAAIAKIREKLIESASKFGIPIIFNEEEEKKEEKPSVWSDPAHERFYNALSVAETGSFDSPWIRTVGKNSTAYGPVQMTLGTVSDFYNRHPDLFKGNEQYVNQFIEQGKKFKEHMNTDDPVYGRGKPGTLSGEEFHEPYMRLSNAVIAGMRKDLERNKQLKPGEFNVGVLTQRWRGVPEDEDPGYYEKVNKKIKELEDAVAPPVVPTPTDTTTQTPPPQPASSEDYIVQRGDTLSAISRRTGRSVDQIAKASGISDPHKIQAGQKIKIPK